MKKYIHKTSILSALVGVFILFTGLHFVAAQTVSTYTSVAGHITMLDSSTQTITINISNGWMGACPSTGCPSNSVTLAWGQVLMIDANGQIITLPNQMKIGDVVTLYQKSSAGTSTPYALKDNSQNTSCGSTANQQNCTGSAGGGGSTGVGVLPSPPVIPPTAVSGGSVTGGAGVSVSLYTSVGANSPDVLTIQQKLQALGYFPSTASATGYYGQVTATAVKSFQAAKNLPTTGVVGPLTRNALNISASISPNASTSQVMVGCSTINGHQICY